MKIILLFCLLVLFLFNQSEAQKIEGDAVIRSQTDVDNFNYTEVTGVLYVKEDIAGSITNLDGLSELSTVGTLRIYDNEKLNDLSGLSSLTTVGNLYIIGNNSLSEINWPGRISTLTGELQIGLNKSLISISGFNNFTSAKNIYIFSNSSLKTVEGFAGVITLDRLVVQENYELIIINAFQNIANVNIHLNYDHIHKIQFVNPFPKLKYVGDLSITNCYALLYMDALSGIQTVTGKIYVHNNSFLRSLYIRLNSFKSLEVSYNPELKQISFPNVRTAGDILIDHNRRFRSLDMPLVTIINSLDIQYNSSFGYDNFAGISNLREVKGLFRLIRNGGMRFSQLGNLTKVGGDFVIKEPYLFSDYGLDSLKTVGNTLYIIGGDRISRMSGFRGLTSVKNIWINNSYELVELGGFDNLEKVPGEIRIIANPRLYNITGFAKLASVGNLTISHNSLYFIKGFNSLTACNRLELNRISIETLDQLKNLKSIKSLRIINNKRLKTLSGLPKLDSYDELKIEGNALIDNLDEFSKVKTVKGDLSISGTGLVNVDSVYNLTAVGNNLRIKDNIKLTNLDGLRNLAAAGTYESDVVEISGNKILDRFCGLHQLFSSGNFRNVSINDNAVNPTVKEIVDAGSCSGENQPAITGDADGLLKLSGSEIPDVYALDQNYPNPFNPETRIRFQIKENTNVSLKIYDMIGKELAILIEREMSPGYYETVFNAETFSSGIYIYRIQAGSFTETKKLMLIK